MHDHIRKLVVSRHAVGVDKHKYICVYHNIEVGNNACIVLQLDGSTKID